MFKLLHGSLIQELAENIHPAVRTLASYVLGLFYTWHLVGCVYWRLASPPGSTPWAPPAEYARAPLYECYIYCVYWAVGSTSGLASFAAPRSLGPLVYTLLVQVAGLFMTGLIIGSLASLVSALNAIRNEQSVRLSGIRSYLSYKRVPNTLKRAVLDYYHFLWNFLMLHFQMHSFEHLFDLNRKSVM